MAAGDDMILASLTEALTGTRAGHSVRESLGKFVGVPRQLKVSCVHEAAAKEHLSRQERSLWQAAALWSTIGSTALLQQGILRLILTCNSMCPSSRRAERPFKALAVCRNQIRYRGRS